jgi:hypothetical protein
VGRCSLHRSSLYVPGYPAESGTATPTPNRGPAPGAYGDEGRVPADEKAAMARMGTLVWDHTRTWRQRLGVKRGGKRGLRGAILETPPCRGPRDRPAPFALRSRPARAEVRVRSDDAPRSPGARNRRTSDARVPRGLRSRAGQRGRLGPRALRAARRCAGACRTDGLPRKAIRPRS